MIYSLYGQMIYGTMRRHIRVSNSLKGSKNLFTQFTGPGILPNGLENEKQRLFEQPGDLLLKNNPLEQPNNSQPKQISRLIEISRSLKQKSSPQKRLHVALICNAFNSMSQRAFLLCKEMGHTPHVVEWESEAQVLMDIDDCAPDIILCPFLTKRIPEVMYSNKKVPCLIVHPGIEGDRGASSIDHAIDSAARTWGVTVLQADEEMDAGDIWATSTFSMSEKVSKSDLYRGEVADAAMECIEQALNMACWFGDRDPEEGGVRPLEYSNPWVKGKLQPNMKTKDRVVNWGKSADDVARRIQAGDSRPGATAQFDLESLLIDADDRDKKKKYKLFGAHVESDKLLKLYGAKPGTLIGQRNGAVLAACGDNTAVWVSHLKASARSAKLPATLALPEQVSTNLPSLPEPELYIPTFTFPETFQEIFAWKYCGATFLWGEFYNGAMSSDQCHRLEQAFEEILCDDSKVIVFMGGRRYFSNGIHLNVIENSADPARESWNNIVAIDDCVKQLLQCKTKMTISAVHGNAGAGGVMMALASDIVWMSDNVVFNPSYAGMSLYGSEYWTYSLPRRVGTINAEAITSSTEPMSATMALEIDMVDDVLSKHNFTKTVVHRAVSLASNADVFLKCKPDLVDREINQQEFARKSELEQMRKCFQDPVYHEKRRSFVYA